MVKAIVDRIAQDASRPDVRWNENIKLRYADWGSGSEARFLSLVWPISERVPYIASGGYAVGDDEPGGRWNVPDPRAVDAVGSGAGLPFDFEFRWTPERCAQLLPGMVIFGNSFSDFYWPLGLHRYFCFMRRSRTPTGRSRIRRHNSGRHQVFYFPVSCFIFTRRRTFSIIMALD